MSDMPKQIDGREVLLRFTPAKSGKPFDDCPDEFAIVRIEPEFAIPPGLMVYQRRGEKWEANAHWCYRHAIAWMLGRIRELEERVEQLESCEGPDDWKV